MSIARYKSYFDLRSQDRQFQPGDEILLLLPRYSSKLLVAWSGPHKVLEKQGKVDYLIDMPRGPKLYHANILKKYHRRVQVNQLQVLDEVSPLSEPEEKGKLSCLSEGIDDLPELTLTPGDPTNSGEPVTNSALTWNQSAQVEDLFLTYQSTFF